MREPDGLISEVRRGGVVIAGVSTRAFAESAWRAGFVCETVDAFGDLDQKARVRNISFHRDLGRRYSAGAAAAVTRRLSVRAAAYVGNFENHPEAVRRLGQGRVLLGNPPDVLERARDPFLLADVVTAAGARAPLTLRRCDAWRAGSGRRWLRKPIRGGGGSGVRPWRPGEPLGPHEIAQEYVDGVPASMVFLADGRCAVLLGLSRQRTHHSSVQLTNNGCLCRSEAAVPSGPRPWMNRSGGHPPPGFRPPEGGVGRPGSSAEDMFGAPPFRYAGSLYPLRTPSIDSRADSAAHASLEDRAAAVAKAVTAAFGLRGINGIDFVLHDDELVVLELNPRYPTSAELIERATGLSIFEAHVQACLGNITIGTPEPPATTPRGQPPRVWGKAIMYARRDIVLADTCTLLDDDAFRDIPFPCEQIRRGQPICTLFADGASRSTCHTRLAAAAEAVERLVESSHPAHGEPVHTAPAFGAASRMRSHRGLRSVPRMRTFPVDSEQTRSVLSDGRQPL